MKLLYPVVRHPTRLLLKGLMQVRIEGYENIPREGPFLLLPNHQSVLDPFLVQGHVRRRISSMTKSTQFTSPIPRWGLPRVHGFPVRRYRTDPQSVRATLRHLEEGRGVCIYPEGERSWDGTLQPLRRGTIRLMLRCGVPVIPCGICGTYDAWPRWSRRPRRARRPVVLAFGRPREFGPWPSLREMDEHVDEAMAWLAGELRRLSREDEDILPDGDLPYREDAPGVEAPPGDRQTPRP